MSALLIGHQIGVDLLSLSQTLKDNTVLHYNKKFGTHFGQYSPLFCLSPVITGRISLLLTVRPTMQGSIVTDDMFLSELQMLLEKDEGRLVRDLPGSASSWVITPNVQTAKASKFADAVAVIRSSSLSSKLLYDEFVEYLVLLEGERSRGYSSHFMRGAIFRTCPPNSDKYDLAFDVFHEIGHQALMVWQSIDKILTSSHEEPVYSQIRKCDRPAIQTFHATVALAYMLFLEKAICEDEAGRRAAERRGASYKGSLEESLVLSIRSIKTQCTMTDIGNEMLKEMEDILV